MKERALDPRDAPAYALHDAARFVRLPAATLRSWTIGRPYPRANGTARFQPLIRPATSAPLQLSFSNLIEAHVLRALRSEHNVSLQALRKAIRYAESSLQIDRLLLRKDLCTEAGRVFLERYGELIELSASGQLAMRRMLEQHLARVEWDARRFPTRLFPFVSGSLDSIDRPIAIDPRIAFGRPVLLSRGVSTQAIVDRLDAGETVEDIAGDYDLDPKEIEEAALYERAA